MEDGFLLDRITGWLVCSLLCGLEEKARCVEGRSIGVGWGVEHRVLDS